MRLHKPWASPEIVDQILQLGREESPSEACGIITPDLQVLVLPNRHLTSSRDSFVIVAEDLVNVIEAWVERMGVDPSELTRGHFMVWHTHPSGSVGPSRGDLDARVDGFLNLVVTMPNGEATLF